MQRLILPFALFGAAAFATTQACAQTRWVFVNGERLSDAEVAQLARVQCSGIPDGRYWLDPRTGAWGYAGNPVRQGWLGDGCRAAPPRRPSLSERGRLYRPGEIIDGR